MGAGRKPLPDEERRDYRVLVRLNEAEHESLDRAAGDEPLGTFLRRVALRYAQRRKARR